MIPRPSNRRLELALILLALLPVGAAFRVCEQARASPSATPARIESAPLGRIEIRRLGISAIIAQGTDDSTLKRAVGHVASTSLPGEPGNVGLAGHRDGLFRGLGRVRKNDLIRIVTPRGSYRYRVAYSAVVGPHRVDVLDSTAVRSLTLITCYPFHWIGHAPKRFVVRAVQLEPLARTSRPPVEGIARRT